MSAESKPQSHKITAAVELVAGVLLLYTTFTPYQNDELAHLLINGCALVYLAAFLFWRSRRLFATDVFFHFAVIATYCLRAASAQGWLSWWFLLIAVSHWAVVLWFSARNPDDPAAPSVFLCIAMITPLFFSVLDGWSKTWPGIAIWAFPVLRSFLLLRKPSPRVPVLYAAFLFLLLCSVPFSLVPWRSFQFLWISTLCVLLSACISIRWRSGRNPIVAGYVFLCILNLAYTLPRYAFLIFNLGPSILLSRLSIVMFHNDLVPYLLILICFLFFLASETDIPIRKKAFLATSLATCILLLLTYSRTGMVALAVLLLTALFLKRRDAIKARSILATVALIVALALLISPLRERILERIGSTYSIQMRLQLQKAGLATIAAHPLFGVGWFNSYVHCKLPPPGLPLSGYDVNTGPLVYQTHSALIDLSESAGVPAGLVFVLLFLISLFRKEKNPILVAGCLAILAGVFLDSAPLWLSNYPHLWILLGASVDFGEELRPNRIRILKVASAVTAIIAVATLYEDHFLGNAFFHQHINDNEQAVKELSYASFCAPFDFVPYETRKDICLSQRDSAGAALFLEKLMKLKKDYPPNLDDSGRIHMLQGDLKGANAILLHAASLDPYGGTHADTWNDLAALALKTNRPDDYEIYLSRSWLSSQDDTQQLHANQLRSLWPDDRFLNAVFNFTLKNIPSNEDWAEAIDTFYKNLMASGQGDLGVKVLELTLQHRDRLDQDYLDYFVPLLSNLYASKGRESEIKTILPLTSGSAKQRSTVRTRLGEGRQKEVYSDLVKMLQTHPYQDVASEWEAYWTTFGPTGVRRQNEILLTLPSEAPDPAWIVRIAETYVQEQNYRRAAQEYHRLSWFNYTDVNAHWREARLWLLAGDDRKAEEANDRAQKLIRSNPITRTLYKSDLAFTMWTGTGLYTMPLHNAWGGKEWRTVIFEHPPAVVRLPEEVRLSEVQGEVALMDGAWPRDSDGVEFKLIAGGTDALTLVSDPVHVSDDRQWKPFLWTSQSGPSPIALATGGRATTSYDWAIWSINTAK